MIPKHMEEGDASLSMAHAWVSENLGAPVLYLLWDISNAATPNILAL